jgi:hypothetical protein
MGSGMEWGTLIPVLVGGVIGIAAGFVGPFALARQKEASDQKKKRAEKFEELVAAIYEFDHWVDNLVHIHAYGDALPSVVSPFAKIQAIASVYFPQFDQKISEFDRATGVYKLWMTTAGEKRIANKLDQVNDGLLDAYKPYVEKRDGLLTALKEFARSEFQKQRERQPFTFMRGWLRF